MTIHLAQDDPLSDSDLSRVWDLIFDQICYSASEAKVACEIFKDKTLRYIVTSSESIYENGANQTEDSFDPKSYDFNQEALPNENYQEAKRQVEAVFSCSALAEVAIARPSLVVGIDDYTDRLKWHIDRIVKSLPIYFPNLDVKSDFIRSDQAGLALKSIGLSGHVGPVNCTSPGSVSLREVIAMCERSVGKKAILASRFENGNHSPYGGSATKTMDTSLLASLGANIESSQIWLEKLIHEIAKEIRPFDAAF